VPTQLLGDWFLPPAAESAIFGFYYPCPSPPTAANCFIQLTLMATTDRLVVTATGGKKDQGISDVVVDNNEIDFFNTSLCVPPDAVGRYTWKLTGGVLKFTLVSDPCARSDIYTYQGGWSRTP
jgi:hypothetical protein